jgi:hypothetical protein
MDGCQSIFRNPTKAPLKHQLSLFVLPFRWSLHAPVFDASLYCMYGPTDHTKQIVPLWVDDDTFKFPAGMQPALRLEPGLAW